MDRAGDARRPPRRRSSSSRSSRRSTAAARLATSLADERRSLLRDLGRRLHPLPALRGTLARSFDPAGELLDTASPRLGPLRAAVRVAYDRLRRRLDSLVGSELGGALQEPIVTLRNGRYVVPVRAEARSKVKGIVHDASGSGQTLFVEPLVVVELGNAWREAQAAVDEEEGRILDELSSLVGANGTLLLETLEALAQFDFWAAKAHLAAELDGVRPEPADRPEIVLLSARHPGLTGRVVPIDLRLGDGYTALVITGPNTGGKTVALRTLGLLCLMHQAGLHVPAATGSKLPVLRDVFADIGDEQSIAQSLSTFSGHLRSIIRIVEHAGPGTLVLLDELGAGTDPTEGSALAQALLDHFIRSGALVAATTHYAEIKVYAHETAAARNASVEFDLESLTPTYRLTIGLPGGSQAFAIAERLGLPAAIVADARGRLTENQQAFESTLASIREQEGEIAGAVERARLAEAQGRGVDAGRRRGAASGTQGARRGRACRARRGGAAGRGPARGRRRDPPPPGARDRDRADHRRRAVERGADARAGCRRPSGQRSDRHRLRSSPGRGASGTAPGAGAAAGRAGSPRWRKAARARRSRPAGCASRCRSTTSSRRWAVVTEATGARRVAGAARGPRRSGIGALQLAKSRTVASSLDLRGARVDEALEALSRYLDDAALAGLEQVLIIHGLGTGALRDAVREQASANPLVKTLRAGERGEGGDGATIVRL